METEGLLWLWANVSNMTPLCAVSLQGEVKNMLKWTVNPQTFFYHVNMSSVILNIVKKHFDALTLEHCHRKAKLTPLYMDVWSSFWEAV